MAFLEPEQQEHNRCCQDKRQYNPFKPDNQYILNAEFDIGSEDTWNGCREEQNLGNTHDGDNSLGSRGTCGYDIGRKEHFGKADGAALGNHGGLRAKAQQHGKRKEQVSQDIKYRSKSRKHETEETDCHQCGTDVECHIESVDKVFHETVDKFRRACTGA